MNKNSKQKEKIGTNQKTFLYEEFKKFLLILTKTL